MSIKSLRVQGSAIGGILRLSQGKIEPIKKERTRKERETKERKTDQASK